MARITFLGASGTVTGSKYLLETERSKILIDSGLFQGPRKWREENWSKPPVDLSTIDAVVLTHAHIDHTGILPRFVRDGLHAPIFCTPPTKALCQVLLPDSGRLQEEEAEWRKRKKRSRHQNPQPLYTEADAYFALQNFKTQRFDKSFTLHEKVSCTFSRVGHILGAAAVQLAIDGKRITFSGDVGRFNVPILCDPQPVEFGDLVITESTYGGKKHEGDDPKKVLERVIIQTTERGGVVLIPAFAVGRTQLILFYLRELKQEKRIPDIPVIIDSPMAHDATTIYREFPEEYDEASHKLMTTGDGPFSFSKLHFVKDRSESIKLNKIAEPMVIISASGMLSGGRILHHLKHRISSPLNTVLFVGYQPEGSRGAWIKSGASSLKLLGEEVDIRARIEEIGGLSAHADEDELVEWCRSSKGSPDKIVIVHGEDESREALKQRLSSEFGWHCHLPQYQETMEL